MCDNRDGKVVIPVTPSAGVGFWIGQKLRESGMPLRRMSGKEAAFHEVNVLWVQHPEHGGGAVILSPGPFEEFDSVPEAMAYLQSKGVVV
jgi:hypothetical protein